MNRQCNSRSNRKLLILKDPEVSLPWRDFANGEMLDNRLSMTLRRRSRSEAVLVDPERADAGFEC